MSDEEKKVLEDEEVTYIPQIPDTVEIPNIENADDREYEKIENEQKGV